MLEWLNRRTPFEERHLHLCICQHVASRPMSPSRVAAAEGLRLLDMRTWARSITNSGGNSRDGSYCALIPRAGAEAFEIGGQSRTAACNMRRLCCGPRY